MPEQEAAADEAAVEEGPPKPPEGAEEDEDMGPEPAKAERRKVSCSVKRLLFIPSTALDLCKVGCFCVHLLLVLD